MDLVDAYAPDADALLATVGSDRRGLTSERVAAVRRTSGFNELAAPKRRSLLAKVLETVVEPMILMLLAATVFSFAIGDWIEGLAILGVVAINTVVGLLQDAKAERAIEALSKMLAPTVRVLRDGRPEIVATRFLVPGDVVLLESGDIVPADARLLDAANLLVDEAHLTGESEPVRKGTEHGEPARSAAVGAPGTEGLTRGRRAPPRARVSRHDAVRRRACGPSSSPRRPT